MTRPTDPHSPPPAAPAREASFDDGVTHEAVDGPLHNPEVAHEHSDINVRAIVYFLAGLSVITIAAFLAMWGVFEILEGQAANNDPRRSPLSAPATEFPAREESPYLGSAPGPRLITREPEVLADQRAKERTLLESGEWVDQKAGIARIPIDEAKKLLVEKGLPARAGEAGDPRLGTRAASMSDASSGRNAVVPEGRKGGTTEGQKGGSE